MANPRKFSEKIALQKQKQAEGTAEFEKIMKEVYATRRDEPLSGSQQRISECCLSPEQGSGGSNNGGGGGNGGGGLVGIPIPGSGGGSSGNGNGGSGSPTAYRESRGRSVGVGPMRRPSDRKVDRSPYSSSLYLSPPMDTSWRRSNSDSAIHQSLILQPENPIYGTQQQQQQHYLQQQQYHQNPRSHSTAASVGLSPTAQRRKAQHMVTQSHSSSNLQHMQMQDQLNHHKLNHNHQQLNNMHPHQQSSMAKSQLQFNPCTPSNSMFKPLQEQAMAMANTGSLPDLTSVHFSNVPSPSPSNVNTHNMRNEREQLQSPFNSQTYQQQQQQQQQQQLHQQHSPGGGQTHLSFTNIPVMVNPSSNHISTNCGTLHSSYGNLPTTGSGGGGGISANATSSGNLNEYRNPQHNPPSPAGSASPGLMVAASPHDIHNSAPNSPIRHNQHQHQQQHQYSDKNIQTYDRFSPSGGGGGGDYSNGSNNLNPSFHNHFEQFSLVDSAQSESQYIPSSLQQDIHSPHNSYSQSLQFDDSLFGHPQQQFSTENGNGAGAKVSGGVTGTTGGDPYLSLSNQNTLNNCSSSNLGLNSSSGGGGSSNNNSSTGVTSATVTASASCSPLHSPHSPNPHSPSNNNSNLGNDIVAIAQQQHQQQQQQQQQHQKSHHTNDGSGRGGGVSNNSSNMHSSTPTSTTPNIPSIVFSDFSNQDYSKEIFDTLDLDLGQMDPAGLQMLSDPTSMIADPNIEDSFRRDLN